MQRCRTPHRARIRKSRCLGRSRPTKTRPAASSRARRVRPRQPLPRARHSRRTWPRRPAIFRRHPAPADRRARTRLVERLGSTPRARLRHRRPDLFRLRRAAQGHRLHRGSSHRRLDPGSPRTSGLHVEPDRHRRPVPGPSERPAAPATPLTGSRSRSPHTGAEPIVPDPRRARRIAAPRSEDAVEARPRASGSATAATPANRLTLPTRTELPDDPSARFRRAPAQRSDRPARRSSDGYPSHTPEPTLVSPLRPPRPLASPAPP